MQALDEDDEPVKRRHKHAGPTARQLRARRSRLLDLDEVLELADAWHQPVGSTDPSRSAPEQGIRERLRDMGASYQDNVIATWAFLYAGSRKPEIITSSQQSDLWRRWFEDEGLAPAHFPRVQTGPAAPFERRADPTYTPPAPKAEPTGPSWQDRALQAAQIAQSEAVDAWRAAQTKELRRLWSESFRQGISNFAAQYPELATDDLMAEINAEDDPDAAMGPHFASIGKMVGQLTNLLMLAPAAPQISDWFSSNEHRVQSQAETLAWQAEQKGYQEAGANFGLTIEWQSEGDDRVCDDCAGLEANGPYTDGGANPLPSFPGDGSTQCGPNCRCSLNYLEPDGAGNALPGDLGGPAPALGPFFDFSALNDALGVDSMLDVQGVTKMQTFDEVASRIRSLDSEAGFAIGADGRIIGAALGDAGSISFTPQELQFQHRAQLVVHNHPLSAAFSPTDVAFAFSQEVGEMRVVSPLYDYHLKPVGKRFVPQQAVKVMEVAQQHVEALYPEVKARATELYHAQFTQADVKHETFAAIFQREQKDFWHDVWTATAKDTKLFTYQRTAVEHAPQMVHVAPAHVVHSELHGYAQALVAPPADWLPKKVVGGLPQYVVNEKWAQYKAGTMPTGTPWHDAFRTWEKKALVPKAAIRYVPLERWLPLVAKNKAQLWDRFQAAVSRGYAPSYLAAKPADLWAEFSMFVKNPRDGNVGTSSRSWFRDEALLAKARATSPDLADNPNALLAAYSAHHQGEQVAQKYADFFTAIKAPTLANTTSLAQTEVKPLGQMPLTFPTQESSLLDMEKVGGPGGSNEGYWLHDKKFGIDYYVKPMDSAHAANEVGAMRAYELAGAVPGVDIPYVSVVYRTDDKPVVVSRKVDFIHNKTPTWWESADGLAARLDARRFWAMDALLSHFDVVGLNNDNLLVKQGMKVAHRVEAGGAMQFRAQGGLKTSWKVGAPWVEPWTMRGIAKDGVTPMASVKPVFGTMSSADAAAALGTLKTLDLATLDKAWSDLGMTATARHDNMAVIKARIAQVPTIQEQLGFATDAAFAKGQEVANAVQAAPKFAPAPPVEIASKVTYTPWNQASDKWALKISKQLEPLFLAFRKEFNPISGVASHIVESYVVGLTYPASMHGEGEAWVARVKSKLAFAKSYNAALAGVAGEHPAVDAWWKEKLGLVTPKTSVSAQHVIDNWVTKPQAKPLVVEAAKPVATALQPWDWTTDPTASQFLQAHKDWAATTVPDAAWADAKKLDPKSDVAGWAAGYNAYLAGSGAFEAQFPALHGYWQKTLGSLPAQPEKVYSVAALKKEAAAAQAVKAGPYDEMFASAKQEIVGGAEQSDVLSSLGQNFAVEDLSTNATDVIDGLLKAKLAGNEESAANLVADWLEHATEAEADLADAKFGEAGTGAFAKFQADGVTGTSVTDYGNFKSAYIDWLVGGDQASWMPTEVTKWFDANMVKTKVEPFAPHVGPPTASWLEQYDKTLLGEGVWDPAKLALQWEKFNAGELPVGNAWHEAFTSWGAAEPAVAPVVKVLPENIFPTWAQKTGPSGPLSESQQKIAPALWQHIYQDGPMPLTKAGQPLTLEAVAKWRTWFEEQSLEPALDQLTADWIKGTAGIEKEAFASTLTPQMHDELWGKFTTVAWNKTVTLDQFDEMLASYQAGTATENIAAWFEQNAPELKVAGKELGAQTQSATSFAPQKTLLAWSPKNDMYGKGFSKQHPGFYKDFSKAFKARPWVAAVTQDVKFSQALITNHPSEVTYLRMKVALARTYNMAVKGQMAELQALDPKLAKFWTEKLGSITTQASAPKVVGKVNATLSNLVATRDELKTSHADWYPSFRGEFAHTLTNKIVPELVDNAGVVIPANSTKERELRALAFAKSYLMAKAGDVAGLKAIDEKLLFWWDEKLGGGLVPRVAVSLEGSPWIHDLNALYSPNNASSSVEHYQLDAKYAKTNRGTDYKSFQRGVQAFTSSSNTTIRESGAAILKGGNGGSWAKSAKLMLEAIQDAPNTAPALMRHESWASVAQRAGTTRAKLAEFLRSKITDPSYTFSMDMVSTQYAGHWGGDLEWRIEKGSQAIYAQPFSSHTSENEFIIAGRFKILRVEETGDNLRIYVRQTSVFDLPD